MLKIPLVGPLLKLFYSARFFQSMSLMTSSNVNLLKAIDLTSNMIEFQVYKDALQMVYREILKGKLLSESLKKTLLFNKRTTHLIKVGEEVNQLDIIFKRLNQQSTEDLNHQLAIITNLLEPLLIIIIGFIVAIILIAMYLPI
ncbi:MAG: type II secretion system F family protein [Salinivirgaceae bacterium]|nr:type II secretion system F family protein [Salinivirgaceae bacterium]